MKRNERKQLQLRRNLGIMAHVDAGKTTVTEQILYHTGQIHQTGLVHEGNTQMDWLDEEKRRGITITSAATSCSWITQDEEYELNLIDTPGHVDFTIEVERSLRVLDGAVAVFCAVGGVEPQSETVWRQAEKHDVPRMAFINKMDRPGADMDNVVEQMRWRLGCEPVLLQIPMGSGDQHTGIIDVITMRAYVWTEDGHEEHDIPETHLQRAHHAREALIEALAVHDEALMESYFAGADIEQQTLRDVLRLATIEQSLVPVLCGSALKDQGIPFLLDAIAHYLPSPLEVGSVFDAKSGEERAPESDAPFSALAFKLMTDPHVGQLTFLRVYSGTLSRGERILNASTGKKERIGQILRMHANRRSRLEHATAGDIIAVIGLKKTKTGDTLASTEEPVVLEEIQAPEPVVWVSVEPEARADQNKLSEALHAMSKEDPSLRIRVDEQTGQTLMGGMGQLHLEVTAQRMEDELNVFTRTGKPRVAYRETLRADITHRRRLKKATGGPGMFAEVELRLTPGEYGSGVQFSQEVREGAVPREFFRAVEEGVRQAAAQGVFGHEMTDFEAVLLDGAYHQVDSSERAFKLCATYALHEAALEAGVDILEPIMDVEIITPEEFVGESIRHLNRCRGQVRQMDTERGITTITASAPLAELFGFVDDLRSHTKGRASASMRLASYARVPETIAATIREA